MTREPKDIIGLPVVAAGTGTEVGAVKALLFEPGQHRLFGLVVNPTQKGAELLLHREDIKAIGDSAVMVEDQGVVTVLEGDETAKELRDHSGFLQGLRILTEDGNEVGKVDTVVLDDDGSVVSYRTASGFLGLRSGTDINREDVVTAGNDAIVVSADIAKRGDAQASGSA